MLFWGLDVIDVRQCRKLKILRQGGVTLEIGVDQKNSANLEADETGL